MHASIHACVSWRPANEELFTSNDAPLILNKGPALMADRS